jgi:hypothetical protein
MKEKNLLASVALFSELYNSETYNTVFDILAEFIKSALIYEQKFSFTSTELKGLLEKIFGFRIPEPVLRTTLNNKLKGAVIKKDGIYHLEVSVLSNVSDIQQEFTLINSNNNNILTSLETYIEQKTKTALTEKDKVEIFNNFNHFLLDNGYSDKYSDHISAFIILNQENKEFHNTLNAIREGLIMYQGIVFTSDINELGKWTTDLVLYLNTEQLFSALGYNGVLFQEIFNDFHKLVSEINLANPNQSKGKKIELKYFEETKNEVENYFLTAESIKRGLKKLDPTKSAMKMIVDTSDSISDIKAKKVKFDIEIRRLGITLQEFNKTWESLKEFNVEDENTLEELRKISKINNRYFDEDQCLQYFKIFTKINYFRRGESNKPIEKIGHLLITENNFAKYLAHNYSVKFSDTDISFAKDIDYITTKFWFRLKKGFSDKQSLPKSFDVVTKAKIILSSHVNSSVANSYQKLVAEIKNGTLTQEEAIGRTYEYREKASKPEEITAENADSTLDFLTDDSYYEEIYRERQRKEELLSATQQKVLDLENEINRRDELEKQSRLKVINEAIAIEKEKFVKERIREKVKVMRSDIIYLISTYLPEFLIVLLGFLFKGNKTVESFIKSMGDNQIFFWIILAGAFSIVLFLRSHIYNKDRIRNAWRSLGIIVSFRLKTFKMEQRDIFEDQFISASLQEV